MGQPSSIFAAGRGRRPTRFLAGIMLGIACFLLLPAAGPAYAKQGAVVVVPPGNRSATQPPIPGDSRSRTAETGGTFEGKYKQIFGLLARDHRLIQQIKKVAAIYDIDPIHIIGAIVGEHTYNVDAFDSLQGYYVKAMAYLGTDISFGHGGVSIADFVKLPEFAACTDDLSDYDLWTCREDVFDKSFRGKTVDGVSYPNDRFGRVFFQPLFSGQTFGIGQLSPLTALGVTDIVHARAGLPLLDMNRAPKVYEAIMGPDSALQYIAATIKVSIDVYRDVANFDISKNPGITATLYNVGHVKQRALELRAQNRGATVLPHENYYGWLVNRHLDELEKLL